MSNPANPPRFPTVLRRLAWVTPFAWILAIVLLSPSIGHGRPVNDLVLPLFYLGVVALVSGIGFCLEDYKAAKPQEYHAVTQTAMWAITIIGAVRWLRRH